MRWSHSIVGSPRLMRPTSATASHGFRHDLQREGRNVAIEYRWVAALCWTYAALCST
jgi:hypothetical protein